MTSNGQWLFSIFSTALPNLPARVVNDDVGTLDKRGVLAFFAGKPAPTGGGVQVDQFTKIKRDNP
ncbi:hypothetical protein FJD34_27500 [Pseudomonas brenneri]|uniref:Uncharacterized protein n=1 Tax=Pseudomonas brenneri TaxID=129817 RepID=A0A5B2UHQ6_9PSED|nr:hypothetical protein F1720_26875 [Pseudomonas brenneri]TWR72516.1 hypothetical protein FJD34_27500 [Pseudomonas brenneri]